MSDDPDAHPPVHIWCWLHCKRLSFGSLTMAWTYFMFAASAFMELLFQVPDVAAQFGFHDWVPPRWMPWYTAGMAVITLAARMRSIIWRDDRIEEYVRHYTDDPKGPM
jgi:hypothetical protein